MTHHDEAQLVVIREPWKKQEGMTGIAIAAILVMLAFFALIAMRLFPVYMEHFSVTTHLENLAADGDTKKMSDKEIWGKLQKTFQIDNVDNVKNEDIIIERFEGGGMTVTIEYEVRTPGLGNVDLVAVFSDEAEVN